MTRQKLVCDGDDVCMRNEDALDLDRYPHEVMILYFTISWHLIHFSTGHHKILLVYFSRCAVVSYTVLVAFLSIRVDSTLVKTPSYFLKQGASSWSKSHCMP